MSKNSNSLLAFIVGAGIGTALGVLFAPDSGSNTRDKLSYRLSKYKKELEDLIEELVEGKELHLNEAKSEGKRVINEAKSKAENLLQDVNKLIDQINKDN
ncbi:MULTISPECIES: YtxH domain-containing protein [Algoriphagus]|uniref:YtxH domain-containing protein n=2 Tax=Algoriphagus TaxID=246875 RepID=A0A4Y9QYC8_9BACT|nr:MULTISPECIES: YtxH domain-containing protein [Algoriphagus]MCS5490666.1 YtxH domain-containing protein [Algoriphagus limi]TFV96055.1 YtxH domain-containing protein [Algoriphagus kandeliae]